MSSQSIPTDSQSPSDKTKQSIGKEIVLIDRDGVKLTLTGSYKLQKDYYDGEQIICFDFIIENNTESNISLGHHSAVVNGWNTSFFYYGSRAATGTKTKGEIGFSLSEAGVSTFDEIESLKVDLCVIDLTNGYRELLSTGLIDIPIHGNSVSE